MTFDVFALRDSVVAESALRALVRQIGAQLKGRGVSDEDDLDTTIVEAKRKAYERLYAGTG